MISIGLIVILAGSLTAILVFVCELLYYTIVDYICRVERKIGSKYKENTVLEVSTPLENRNPRDIVEVIVSAKKPKKVISDVEFKNSEVVSELPQQILLKEQLVYEESLDVQPSIIVRQQFKPNHLVESDKIIFYVSKGNKGKETTKDK